MNRLLLPLILCAGRQTGDGQFQTQRSSCECGHRVGANILLRGKPGKDTEEGNIVVALAQPVMTPVQPRTESPK